jgi:hypothetical protein
MRKSTRDVVRVQDVLNFIDISEVKQYICNRSMVVYLKKRPGNKGSGPRSKHRYLWTSTCVGCKHIIESAYRFSSIGCKDVGYCFPFFRTSHGRKLGNHFSESLLCRKRLHLTRHKMLACLSTHSSLRMALNLPAHSIRSQHSQGVHARGARNARHSIEPYAPGEEDRID